MATENKVVGYHNLVWKAEQQGLFYSQIFRQSLFTRIQLKNHYKDPPSKGSTTFPNIVTNKGASVQVHEQMEDISYSNH